MSESVTFSLELEFAQPPRPGPAFLTRSQNKQGARVWAGKPLPPDYPVFVLCEVGQCQQFTLEGVGMG